MPTATETKTVTFIAQSPEQVLTRRPVHYVSDGLGGRMALTYEEYLEREKDANRQREMRGEEPLPIDDTLWKVEFQNHMFETDDPVLIEWLRAHNLFENVKGFWEQGAAPDEEQPTLAAQMDSLNDASAAYDRSAVEAVIAEEKNTHNRTAVLQVADAALRRIDEAAAELEADAHPSGEPPSTSKL